MFISKLLTVFGFFCLILACVLFWQRNNPRRITFSEAPKATKLIKEVKIPPIRIAIKRVNIDLAIFPAKIRNQNWDLTTQGASWLDISPIPGELGNSILYGHNWTNLMGNLIFVKPGEEIEIDYKDGTKKIFVVDKTAIVSPNNVSVLRQTNDKRITIYTCTGLFDEKRFIVAARLSDSSKN